MRLTTSQIKMLGGLLFGLHFVVGLLWAAWVIHGGIWIPSFALTVAISFLGTSLGWATGILASPYDDTELKRFATYAGLLSVFITGYLSGKLDPVITRVLKDPTEIDVVIALRLTVFATCLIIGTIGSYAYRAYAFGPKSKP